MNVNYCQVQTANHQLQPSSIYLPKCLFSIDKIWGYMLHDMLCCQILHEYDVWDTFQLVQSLYSYLTQIPSIFHPNSLHNLSFQIQIHIFFWASCTNLADIKLIADLQIRKIRDHYRGKPLQLQAWIRIIDVTFPSSLSVSVSSHVWRMW